MTICTVPNLTMVIEELTEAGFCGGGGGRPQSGYEAGLPPARWLLVMGAEHRGISRLVKEHCDLPVRIPMYGQISSLNVGQLCRASLRGHAPRHAI